MKPGDLLPGLRRPIAMYPQYIKICGSVNAAYLLSQLFYWTDKQRDPRGWIEKRIKVVPEDPAGVKNPLNQSLEYETRLTYCQLSGARRLLRDRGFLSERTNRLDHRLFFRLNQDAIRQAWLASGEGQAEAAVAGAVEGHQGDLEKRDSEPRRSRLGASEIATGEAPERVSIKGTSKDYTETTPESSSRETSTATPAAGEGESKASEVPIPEIPRTPTQAMRHPAIQLFQSVCGRIPGEKQYRIVIETMNYVQAQKGEGTVAYLQPFWLAWSSRTRRSDGQPYDPSSLAWLTEWALNGAIPPESGGDNGLRERNAGGTGLEERDRPFTAEQLSTLERINAKAREEGLPDLQRNRDVEAGSPHRTP